MNPEIALKLQKNTKATLMKELFVLLTGISLITSCTNPEKMQYNPRNL
jgi:hypothetical protein